jgi:hypothetical protein
MWFLNFPPNSTNIDFDEGMQGFIRNRPDLIPMALLEWAIILGILLWVILVGINLFVQQKSEEDI